MFVRKLNLDTFGIENEWQKILHNSGIEKFKQICINTAQPNSDDYTQGTGSLVYDWDNHKKYLDENNHTNLYVPKKKEILNEDDFKFLCTRFENTAFDKLFSYFRLNFHVGRIRLMKLSPKTCLTWHKDDSIRIHLPLKTNSSNFIIIENTVNHLELNQWYKVDTAQFHTAMNASYEDRIHLVVNVLNNYDDI